VSLSCDFLSRNRDATRPNRWQSNAHFRNVENYLETGLLAPLGDGRRRDGRLNSPAIESRKALG
jgi:hypothetical protein